MEEKRCIRSMPRWSDCSREFGLVQEVNLGGTQAKRPEGNWENVVMGGS